ncbi:putative DNA repair endonuclease XPF isoform X3 [Apostichopus japonicus]|uniref:DNA repair endonuclease XPF n=1 Tax=Stichopus japonicus TaxID=307972 RepID=A0A2G8K656_STIJA|nr:putative DNA repair endonuclease XPF isoform X3 [Apostichopus japonicus]
MATKTYWQKGLHAKKGLGMERLFTNLLQLYCDPGNLVLVLNTSEQEQRFLMEELEKVKTSVMPRVVNNEVGTTERQAVYLEGGVLFITSRILVVDLLTDRIPTHLVTGIIINKAHKIIDSCQEAFILRLFRQKNKEGFIKAFSDYPQAFRLDSVRWSEFHANVHSVMEKHKIDVVELDFKMTPAMQAIQLGILDIINACIKEIKRTNTTLDMDELTVENAIGKKSLDQVVRRQLDPIWHQLTATTKQLVADLKLLRMLLFYLTQYDCVTFYNFLNTLRGSKKAVLNNSGWLFLDSTESVFLHAKERIYGSLKKAKKEGSKEDEDEKTPKLVLEENPKWRLLAEVLDEVKEENKKSDETGHIMVCASDDRTCAQLRDFLKYGSFNLLKKLYNKTLGSKEGTSTEADQYQGDAKGGRGKPAAGKRSYKGKERRSKRQHKEDEQTLTQMTKRQEDSDDTDDEDEEEGGQDDKTKNQDDKRQRGFADIDISSSDAYFGIETAPLTVIHPLHGCKDSFSLTKTLNEIRPRYVVLYDAEMQFVRQLEVYRCCNPGVPLRVYFLMYTGSTEEQRYLTTLRVEKEAFEHLIKEKATMVVPEEIEGKSEDDPQLSRGATPASDQSTSTRKGGAQAPPITEQQKVIVDMREFRSELPSLIHKRGIDIEPVTLEVGDYIITPEICVERKSISDLIGSLGNGRLYNQALAMTRFYKKPVLLIEFDPTKSFALQSKASLSREISFQNLSSKLALLTIHFPKLRILWCPSPHATAELFEELKKNRAQPDGATAASVTLEENAIDSSSSAVGRYNHGPYDMLLKLPGVNSKNCWKILRSVKNLKELSRLSEAKLKELLGTESNATQLWDFFHKEQRAETSKPTARTTFRGARTGKQFARS